MGWDGRLLAAAQNLPIADQSVQCVITSPPYWGLRRYQIGDSDWGDWSGQLGLEPTPELYVAHLTAVFSEVWRVLKDDGTLWLVLGDSYAGAGYSNHANTGGAQRDDGGKQKHTPAWRCGAGRADGIVDERAQRNRDGVGAVAGLKAKDLIGIPWRVAFALQSDGWYLRSDIIWAKSNPMPESVTDRPTKSHEHVFLLAKTPSYYYDAEAIREPSITSDPRRPYTSEGAWEMDGRPEEQRHGGELRNPHYRAPSRKAKANGVGFPELRDGSPYDGTEMERNKRDVWTISTAPYPEAHYAVFPPDLVRPCILAGSRPGDIVLDPFAGSGTVAMVCEELSRRWISVDLGYQELQLRRLRDIQKQFLF